MIPEVETQRLILRGQRLGDFDAYASFWDGYRAKSVGGPVARRVAWDSFAADAGQWTLRGYGMWIVEEKASGAPAGCVGFYEPERYDQTELGWTLFDGFEGRGIAFEAASAARDFGARSLGIFAPASFIETSNARSIALAERLGATLETTLDNGNGPFHIYRHLAAGEASA